VILDGHSKTVSHGLIHCVSVNFITESLIGFSNRGPGESSKSGMRECFSQDLCIGLGHHGSHVFVSVLAELEFLCMLKLRSVCLVRETNDIGAHIDQTNFIILSVAELLNGADVETSAFPATKLLA